MPFRLGKPVGDGIATAALYVPPLSITYPRVALRLCRQDGVAWQLYPADLFANDYLQLGCQARNESSAAGSIFAYAARSQGWLLYVRCNSLNLDTVVGGMLAENGLLIEINLPGTEATPVESLHYFPGVPFNFVGVANMLGAQEESCPWLAEYRQHLSASEAPFVLLTPGTAHAVT